MPDERAVLTGRLVGVTVATFVLNAIGPAYIFFDFLHATQSSLEGAYFAAALLGVPYSLLSLILTVVAFTVAWPRHPAPRAFPWLVVGASFPAAEMLVWPQLSFIFPFLTLGLGNTVAGWVGGLAFKSIAIAAIIYRLTAWAVEARSRLRFASLTLGPLVALSCFYGYTIYRWILGS